MKTRLGIASVAAVAVVAGVTPAQPSSEPAQDLWKPLRFFLGSWEGTGEGRFGTATVERTYELVLDDSFVLARNTSVYPPQERNPRGEEHEDWAFFSYDKAKRSFVVREFHNESIVNTYVLTEIADDGGTLVFDTEHVENFIPGWRARQTYRILDEDSFEEVFELGGPDEELRTFITNRFRRRGS